MIILTNRSWQKFAPLPGSTAVIAAAPGKNLVQSCLEAGSADAQSLATGLQSVLAASHPRFEAVYTIETELGAAVTIRLVMNGLAEGGGVLTLTDETDLVETRARLQSRANAFRAGQRIARIGSWDWEPATGRMRWSGQLFRMLGLTPGQHKPSVHRYLRALHPEDRPAFMARLRQAQASKTRATDADHRIIRPDGAVLYVHPEFELLRDAGGRLTRIDGVLQDITSRTLTEQALTTARRTAESAHRAKSTFLSNMSHELRTPLNAILGFSAIMESEMFGPIGHEKYKTYIRDIATSGRNLLDIINAVLDLVQIEKGELPHHERWLNMSSLLDDCVRWTAPRAAEAGLQFHRDLADALPALRGDAYLIKQALLNLLANAVKFTPLGGQIRLAARPAGAAVEIAITDTGPGMTEDQLELALQPFGQIDSSLSRRYEGAGLGLPLSKAFIEMQGGRFHIHSQPGQGTSIRVLLRVQ